MMFRGCEALGEKKEALALIWGCRRRKEGFSPRLR